MMVCLYLLFIVLFIQFLIKIRKSVFITELRNLNNVYTMNYETFFKNVTASYIKKRSSHPR